MPERSEEAPTAGPWAYRGPGPCAWREVYGHRDEVIEVSGSPQNVGYRDDSAQPRRDRFWGPPTGSAPHMSRVHGSPPRGVASIRGVRPVGLDTVA